MIFTILAIAFFLRLINLNQSLWLDEAVQAITAKESFAYIFQEIVGDFHPPLYHFLMHFWVRVFGSSEIALRMPSVLFGVGTVWVIYKIAQKLSVTGDRLSVDAKLPIIDNRSLAAIVALFGATAPFHVYYSQEARAYAMTCFFAALSMFFFLRVISYQLPVTRKKPITGNWSLVAGYFVVTALLLYSDYFGFLILAAQFLVLLWQKKYKYLLITNCLLLIAYLPWLPMFMTQMKIGMTATRVLPEWGRLVNLSFVKALPLTFIKFSIGRITIFNKAYYFVVSCMVFLIYGFLILKSLLSKGSVTSYRLSVSERKLSITDNRSVITILLWLGVPLVLAWGMSVFVPNYQPFRLLLVLPAFYLLLALGILPIRNKRLQLLAAGSILTVNLVSLAVYFFNPYFHREGWRELVKYLKAQNNSAVILPSETSDWPIKYYDPKNKINLIYGGKGVNQVNVDKGLVIGERLSVISDRKVYYIRYLVPLFDPNEKILQKLESSNYSKIKETSFNQIPVWEFEKK